jgi:uncharacterized protein DUF4238
MAKKKNQHVVPQVHLRQFIVSDRPGHPIGRPLTPFVWLVPRNLVDPPIPRSPRKAFVATRAYNQCDDDPEAPFLEEAFARAESLYGRTLPKLLRGEDPDVRDWAIVVLFIGTLYSRTLGNIDHWQAQFEQLEHLHRQVERAHTGDERQSDRLFAPGSDMSRRELPGRIAAYAQVVARGGWLLRNRGPMEFVSADNPVIHKFLHVDDLEGLGFPRSWLGEKLSSVHRGFVSACVLSPRLAFLCSPLFTVPTVSAYRATASERVVFAVNELLRDGASSLLIATSPQPYGRVQAQVAALDRVAAARYAATPFKLSIYTTKSRQVLGVTSVEHEVCDGPLTSRIRFRTPHIAQLHALATDHRVTEVTIQEGEEEGGGMLGGVFTAVALSPDAESVIEQDLVQWPLE